MTTNSFFTEDDTLSICDGDLCVRATGAPAIRDLLLVAAAVAIAALVIHALR